MEFVMKMKADAVIVGTGVGGLFSALNLPRDKNPCSNRKGGT